MINREFKSSDLGSSFQTVTISFQKLTVPYRYGLEEFLELYRWGMQWISIGAFLEILEGVTAKFRTIVD